MAVSFFLPTFAVSMVTNNNLNNKIMATIKIGTKVKVRFFGGETKIAKVTGIERWECGEKYGEPVDSVTTSQLRGCDYDYT